MEISIHAPPRGATTADSRSAHPRFKFQFTPLREGRPERAAATSQGRKFQFTPLREGRRNDLVARGLMNPISIHAPPRGATSERVAQSNQQSIISIHAPPRGATCGVGSRHAEVEDFNSRPSARGDIGRFAALRSWKPFQFTPLREGRPKSSKRIVCCRLFQFTPLREGRHCLPRDEGGVPYFNSRPSARGDRFPGDPNGSAAEFQFTPLREGRRLCCFRPSTWAKFQFTPLREGRRGHQHAGRHHQAISIHAPPRGATCSKCFASRQRRYFNSRPSARGDAARERYYKHQAISIHAPPRGATRCWEKEPTREEFQFTPLREGRPPDTPYFSRTLEFQFTPLREGRPDVRRSR